MAPGESLNWSDSQNPHDEVTTWAVSSLTILL